MEDDFGCTLERQTRQGTVEILFDFAMEFHMTTVSLDRAKPELTNIARHHLGKFPSSLCVILHRGPWLCRVKRTRNIPERTVEIGTKKKTLKIRT